MAERRMISLRVVDDDRFLDMSAGARLLYYDLAVRADDDGFITPKKVMRLTGTTQKNLDELIESGFVIPFESGVVVITHWRQSNALRKDRYTKTEYQKEFSSLVLVNDRYEIADPDRQPIGNQTATDRQPDGDNPATSGCQMVAVGKDRLGKDSTGKGRKEETRISNDILVEKKGPEEGPEASGSPKENEQPVFIEIPVIGGKNVPIPESFATQMQELYPAIDVREEIRRAKAWLLANPRNAKKDWKRFINMWLSRAQDRARAPARPQGRVSKDYDPNASHSGEGYISVEF